MPTPTSIDQAWHAYEAEQADGGQPTCYEPFNPFAPWRAASSRLTADFEDIEFAREFVATGGHATTLAGSRCASPASYPPRSAMSPAVPR